ncbi:leukocidin/hemolysin toxin family protein [Staphylococcus sp. SS251]|nr:leukocidin/hemolysin toxin family protein [Staphylococcus singaporensis]MBE5664669.1 leukocidin/hemolysin toxin family protein [Staphylococcus singaporensis]MBE5667047.1 leukocidin/hemolysin toxin family protein [Staphylococcus singaporensis]MBE5673324.1 leukocidin/hemolysin toxin family protein [Staphylococcus singaporensis]MBE5679189.1 leukocidin/hemolysin toxin family protein [Staphylococcus singaporensis]
MKNKKRVLLASSLSCALLLLTAADTSANTSKEDQNQSKKENVDKSQHKDKRDISKNSKNTAAPDDVGKNGKVTKRTVSEYDEKTNILQNLQFDFIDDPTYDKHVLLVKKQGSIHSNLKFESHKEEKNSNWLKYPSEYHVDFQVKRNPKTEILDQLPKNKISTAKVDSTFSYSSGGKFDSTKGIGRTSSNSYSKTISYNQQNYDTIASGKNNNWHVHWSVVANDLKYGGEVKNRNDELLFYRNTRIATVENPELSFASKYRYPALVRSGFNPEFLTYLSNEKSNEKTQFEVTYTRNLDILKNKPGLRYAPPILEKNKEGQRFIVTYEVDWKNKTVKVIDKYSDNKSFREG